MTLPIAERFEEVLVLADHYTPQRTPRMLDRQVLLQDAGRVALAHVNALSGPGLRWKVKAGGAVGNYSPAPWIRLFDERFSPRTTEGFYLCWLFSARGDAVHLSLNQGTSEFRANKWRPIADGRIIEARAAGARALVTAWPHRLVTDGAAVIDLGADRRGLGREARDRIRNYELGHIAGFSYQAGEVPTDERLLEDLDLLAPLLADLYGQASPRAFTTIETAPPVRQEADPPSRPEQRAQRQGRSSDAELNRAIELYAMDSAASYFEAEGWTCRDVSAHKPYDFEIFRDGLEVHVEVKGTTSHGQAINLTHREVRHTTEYENCVLAIVANVEISYVGSRPVATGGQLTITNPWRIDERRLLATDFRYDLRGIHPMVDIRAAETG